MRCGFCNSNRHDRGHALLFQPRHRSRPLLPNRSWRRRLTHCASPPTDSSSPSAAHFPLSCKARNIPPDTSATRRLQTARHSRSGLSATSQPPSPPSPPSLSPSHAHSPEPSNAARVVSKIQPQTYETVRLTAFPAMAAMQCSSAGQARSPPRPRGRECAAHSRNDARFRHRVDTRRRGQDHWRRERNRRPRRVWQ